MSAPRLTIDTAVIAHNAALLQQQLQAKGLQMAAVTKVCRGHPDIAQVLLNAGITQLADARVENIERMRQAGIAANIMLIRAPMLSDVARVVRYCNISINTELPVLTALSKAAMQQGCTHQVMLMIELGDLREGVMPDQLDTLVNATLSLPNIDLIGLGTNLTCRYGVVPNEEKMRQLAHHAKAIEQKYGLTLSLVSGGNSANIPWVSSLSEPARVNHLRIGEAIFTGHDTLTQQPIKGALSNAFTLTGEVIEANQKPSMPWGVRQKNAFGETPEATDRGNVQQAIIALGRQDVDPGGLIPPEGLFISGSSSDHLLIESQGTALSVGQEITFTLTYAGILSAMTSPFITQKLA